MVISQRFTNRVLTSACALLLLSGCLKFLYAQVIKNHQSFGSVTNVNLQARGEDHTYSSDTKVLSLAIPRVSVWLPSEPRKHDQPSNEAYSFSASDKDYSFFFKVSRTKRTTVDPDLVERIIQSHMSRGNTVEFFNKPVGHVLEYYGKQTNSTSPSNLFAGRVIVADDYLLELICVRSQADIDIEVARNFFGSLIMGGRRVAPTNAVILPPRLRFTPCEYDVVTDTNMPEIKLGLNIEDARKYVTFVEQDNLDSEMAREILTEPTKEYKVVQAKPPAKNRYEVSKITFTFFKQKLVRYTVVYEIQTTTSTGSPPDVMQRRDEITKKFKLPVSNWIKDPQRPNQNVYIMQCRSSFVEASLTRDGRLAITVTDSSGYDAAKNYLQSR